MKNVLVIGLVFLFQNQVANSQIDSLKYGLKGEIIRALGTTTTSPAIFYAGLKGPKLGSGLIFKSDDSGETWLAMNNGAAISPYVSDIQAIAIANDPSKTIYAGTWKDGLYKSKDNGESWVKDLNCPSSDIRSIKTGIQSKALVYAATSSFGIIKSIDGGESWNRINPEVIDSTFKFAWSIEIDTKNDSILFAQTYSKGVWKSIDQGETWNRVLDTNGKVAWDMKISENSKEIWVAASVGGDSLSAVYYSANNGDTWIDLPDVPQIGISQINVIDSDNKRSLIIGSWQQGVFIHKNENWIKSDFVDFNTISEILVNNGEILIGSWGNGTYKLQLP